jgi:alpha-1,2-glucosyltransferase
MFHSICKRQVDRSPLGLPRTLQTSLGACCVRQNNVVWAAFVAGDALLRIWAEAAARVSAHKNNVSLFSVAALLALRKPHASRQLAAVALPFGAVFAAAAAFLVWNGGIVVGDRTQHEAVFHFAQLGYACGLLFAYAAADAADIGVRLAITGWAGLSCGQRGWLSVLGRAFGISFAAAPASTGAHATLKQSPGLTGNGHSGRAGSHCRVHISTPRLLLALLVLSAATACFAVLQDGHSYEHAYLLADNRHYAFYIWNRVLRHRRWLRLCLVPLYVGGSCVLGAKVVAASAVHLTATMSSPVASGTAEDTQAAAHSALVEQGNISSQARINAQHGLLLSAGYLLATALVVVPARLIEPRYFILPAVFGLLLARPVSRMRCLLLWLLLWFDELAPACSAPSACLCCRRRAALC